MRAGREHRRVHIGGRRSRFQRFDTLRPVIAVVLVIFTVHEGQLSVLLIERSAEPYAGCWALPGGELLPGESLQEAAVRKLADEVIETHRARAKARGVSLEQELREVLRRAAAPTKEELLDDMARCRAMTPPGPRTAAEDVIREVRDSE